MANDNVLSSGLDVLFQAEKPSASSPIASGVKTLSLQVIVPGVYQPRQHFDEAALQELADSIVAQGLIQPIVVRAIDDARYEIIAGERRWRASQLAGLNEIQVIERNVDDNVVAAFSLIENIQREDLNPLEEAEAFQRLIDEFQLTHQEVSERVGRSRPSISNAIRLLELTEYAKSFLTSRQLEMGHARALLSLNENDQATAVDKIIRQKLTVRQTEQLVQQLKSPTMKTVTSLRTEEKAILASWRQRLSPCREQVKIKMDAPQNITISVQCHSLDEAEQLVNDIERLKLKP